MPSEPSTEAATNGDPADEKPGDKEGADDTAEADGKDDLSYEERVVDELVPDVSVGDDTKPDTHEVDAEPQDDAEAAAEAELSDALEEIDDDLLNAFIRIVVSIKAGTLLISIGLLVIGFQGLLAIGGGLITVGCLAFGHAAQRYWNHKQTRQQGDDRQQQDGKAGRNG